jgi:hypothetical protein
MTTTTRPEVLMTLRLHGTPAECAAAAERLRRTPGLHITDQSRPYPDHTGELVRVYLTADLADADRPDDPGGGRR